MISLSLSLSPLRAVANFLIIFKGMPLGNLTSQFFANVYLNELDQFVKHKLKAKYSIRYVDDFVILHDSKEQLKIWKQQISEFLTEKLKLKLHPDKSKIINLNKGINFLGFRIFFSHKLLRKSNMKYFNRKFAKMKFLFKQNLLHREKFIESLEGWLTYCSNANSYKYKRHLIRLANRVLSVYNKRNIINFKKHQNFIRKVKESNSEFTVQKTLFLYKKGFTIKEIAKKRFIKEATVWKHLINLIEYDQLSLIEVLSKDKIYDIVSKIRSKNDNMKDIKRRLKDNSITYDEIACVFASFKK